MVSTPLKNIRQLGWWHSHIVWKNKCSKPPTRSYGFPMVFLWFSMFQTTNQSWLRKSRVPDSSPFQKGLFFTIFWHLHLDAATSPESPDPLDKSPYTENHQPNTSTCQWPFQDIWPYMVQYLHVRILEISHWTWWFINPTGNPSTQQVTWREIGPGAQALSQVAILRHVLGSTKIHFRLNDEAMMWVNSHLSWSEASDLGHQLPSWDNMGRNYGCRSGLL